MHIFRVSNYHPSRASIVLSEPRKGRVSLLWRAACSRHHVGSITQQRIHVAASVPVAMYKTAMRIERPTRAAMRAEPTHLRNELLTLMPRSQSRLETRADSACSRRTTCHKHRTASQQCARTSSRALVDAAIRWTVDSLLAIAGPASTTN